MMNAFKTQTVAEATNSELREVVALRHTVTDALFDADAAFRTGNNAQTLAYTERAVAALRQLVGA